MTRRKNRLNKDELADIETWDRDRKAKEKTVILANKIEITCRSKNQKDVIKSIEKNIITAVIGEAGTGKTYLSCARALKFLKDDPFTYKKIVLIKSVNVPKDEEIGYLKGTMEEKMELYTYPFISNFIKVIGKQATDELKAARAIEILPIKFALGVTLDNSIIIVDEAQQISKDNLRTIITRLGQDSKMIFLGDIKQKSVNKHSKSALEVLLQHFSDIAGVGVIQLGVEDIVRHPIIKQLVEVFDKIENIEHLNGK